MTMIVEFVGLPGSGKTTLKAELESALVAAGILVLGPKRGESRRIRQKFGSLWRSRTAVLAAARALKSDSRPIAQRVRAMRWLATTLELYHEAHRLEMPGAVLILSEGVAQRALLAFLDAQSSHVSSHVGAYVPRIPKPDMIVHLRIDPVVSVQRQQSRRLTEGERGDQRAADRFHLEPDRLLTAMQLADQLLLRMVDNMATERGVEVICLDTNDLDAAATGLMDRVVPRIIHRAS